jgi:hypothetical protein
MFDSWVVNQTQNALPDNPYMQRRHADRAVRVDPIRGRVFHWWRDQSVGLAIAKRAESELKCYCVPYTHHHDNVWSTPYIVGRRGIRDEVSTVLEALHRDWPQRMATRTELENFYPLRILYRLAGHPIVNEVREWKGWDRLVTRKNVPWGTFHGDATMQNSVVTPGGRVMLIDHSHMRQGPLEYDWAKLEVSWGGPEDGVEFPAGDVVTAICAGMIGSHIGETEELFIDIWRRRARHN